MNHKFYSRINKFSLIFSDFVALFLATFIAYYVSTPDDFSLEIDEITDSVIRLNLFFFTGLGVIGWLWVIYRHYSYRKPFWDELRDIYITLFFASIVNLSLLVFTKNHFSLMTWAYVWGIAVILFPCSRILCKRFLSKLGCWQINSVIIGNQRNAKSVYNAISGDSYLGYCVNAFVSPADTIPVVTLNSTGYITGSELLENIDQYQMVFIALEKEQEHIMEKWVRKLNNIGFRNISIIPPLQGVPLYGTRISYFFSSEVIILRIKNNLAKRSSKFIKRCFDIVLSSFFLTALSPLLCYLFFKIKKDGGSAIYSQIRIGQDGKAFHCYKFRTMSMDALTILRELLENDLEAKEEWDKSFKLKNDPRITEIGKFLRRTSLDELPQLWNVLRGDMSLVGPRPVIRQELSFYGDDLNYYYMTKPGMTGLWQISGRSDTTYSTRVYLDAWYVKNWSLWNDITILAKTVGVVLKGKGAY